VEPEVLPRTAATAFFSKGLVLSSLSTLRRKKRLLSLEKERRGKTKRLDLNFSLSKSLR
jgi:hypothetical protein